MSEESEEHVFGMMVVTKLMEKCEQLKAERDRYKAALEAIADYVNLHRVRQQDWDVQYLHAIEEKIKECFRPITSNDTKES